MGNKKQENRSVGIILLAICLMALLSLFFSFLRLSLHKEEEEDGIG
jgi:hypothetical protein